MCVCVCVCVYCTVLYCTVPDLACIGSSCVHFCSKKILSHIPKRHADEDDSKEHYPIDPITSNTGSVCVCACVRACVCVYH